MLQENPQMLVRDAMRKVPVFQCEAPDCREMFASKPNRVHYYAQEHAGKRTRRADISHRQLFHTVVFDEGQEMIVPTQELEGEADQRIPEDDEVVQAKRNKARRPRRYLNLLQAARADRRWNRNA
jgi:hypothetical protein